MIDSISIELPSNIREKINDINNQERYVDEIHENN